MLELLAVLAIVDGEATGPAAWSAWKAGLVAELVARTGAVLAGRPLPPQVQVPSAEHVTLMSSPLPAVEIADGRVTVAVPDRPGVLGLVAGVLAMRGVDVRRAAVGGAGGVAVEVFDVATAAPVDQASLVRDLAAALAGTLGREVGPARARRGARGSPAPEGRSPAGGPRPVRRGRVGRHGDRGARSGWRRCARPHRRCARRLRRRHTPRAREHARARGGRRFLRRPVAPGPTATRWNGRCSTRWRRENAIRTFRPAGRSRLRACTFKGDRSGGGE